MADITAGIYNFTTPAVLVFPNLFEAVAFKRGGKETGAEPKFGASFVIDPIGPDFAGIKAVAAKVARAKWPGLESLKGLKFPWDTGEALKARRIEDRTKKGLSPADDGKSDFQLGKVVLKASSKFAPKLSVIENGKITDLEPNSPLWTASKTKFYFGVEVLAQINLVAYDKINPDAKDGVTAYLNLVLSTNKGKKLSSGSPSAAEVFKGYAGAASAEDPTGADEEF